jgi:Ca-activated chloride channel family protein
MALFLAGAINLSAFDLGIAEWGATQYGPLFVIGLATFFIFLVACLVYKNYKARRARDLLAGTEWASVLVTHFSRARSKIKIIVSTLGLFFLFIALLRPQGKSEEDVQQEGRDLYVALDISRSMLAADCAPTRLACAKQKIKQMLPLLTCERVGLILFSGSAFVQCPLTRDISAFTMFLDQVDTETISSGSTVFGRAIQKALDAFEDMPNKKNKLLVIVTDGEDFSSDLTALKERARDQGLHIFALGVGSVQGAPVPAFDVYGKPVGHQRDSKGAIVISRLNEQLLAGLAHDVGGEYIKINNSSSDSSDIKKLVSRVQLFEKESFGAQKIRRAEEKYSYFVLVAFICFLLDWLL